MVKTRTNGKICFVSSTLGYMSVVGYASYAPGKHALRGLAETLRSEFKLYGIDVHIFFPCTMYTPGYERENATKPSVTLKLEESDPGLTARRAAQGMLNGLYLFWLPLGWRYSTNLMMAGGGLGVKKHHSHITADFITEVFRASTQGSSPSHFFLKDWGLKVIGSVSGSMVIFWFIVECNNVARFTFLEDARRQDRRWSCRRARRVSHRTKITRLKVTVVLRSL